MKGKLMALGVALATLVAAGGASAASGKPVLYTGQPNKDARQTVDAFRATAVAQDVQPQVPNPAQKQAGTLREKVRAIIFNGMKNKIVPGGTGYKKRTGMKYLDSYNEALNDRQVKALVLTACMRWDVQRIEDVNNGEVSIRASSRPSINSAKRGALKYCGVRFSGCQCEVVEVNGKLVLEIPDAFAERFAGQP